MALADKIVRDPFTDRLLAVMIELVKKDALSFKKHFAVAVDILLTTLYQIERGDRNYPLDENKRALAILSLKEKYYVNPSYMTGGSSTMFYREPEKAKRKTGKGIITNISNSQKLIQYEEEIKSYKSRIAELEAALDECSKNPVAYVQAIKKSKIKTTKPKS